MRGNAVVQIRCKSKRAEDKVPLRGYSVTLRKVAVLKPRGGLSVHSAWVEY